MTSLTSTVQSTANATRSNRPLIPEYSKPVDIYDESWSRIVTQINDILAGVMSFTDRNGQVVRIKPENFRLQMSTTFEDPLGTVAVWPNGDAILLTNLMVGKGLTKTVYTAIDLRNGKSHAAAFADKDEIDVQGLLKSKRGIAQIYNHMFGEFKGRDRRFFYGELYDTDLRKEIQSCSLEDLKVVVKDLVYAIIALEGDDPKGDWISHGDIKDANIFLKIDKVTGRVLGAYLGDFGNAGKKETKEIDEKTLAEDMERSGCPRYAQRETQRERFISTVFHQIKTHLERRYKKTIFLKELCANDPVCEKLMGEMEEKYGDILKQKYSHWLD